MPRSRRARCQPLAALPILALGLATATAGAAAEPEAEGTGALPRGSAAVELGDEETTYIAGPAYPGAADDVLRVQLGTFFFPDASLEDGGRVDHTRPELRLRANLPVLDLFALRLNGNLGTSHYDFSDGTPFAELERGGLVLYRTGISVDAAVRLNPEDRWLFVKDEVWSLGTRLGTGSSFERKAFDDGVASTVAIGVGYRDGDRLRLTVGAAIATSLENGDVGLSPVVSLRWRPAPKLTVSDRGLGLRIAYQWFDSLEVFVNGYRTSDEYALRPRSGDKLPVAGGIVLGPDKLDDLTFRDRQWQVGAGFEWKHNRAFRINFEAGAVVDRELRLESQDDGQLFAQDADPSAYVGLRFEVRFRSGRQ